MSCLYYKQQTLFVENVPLSHIAERYGTPIYVYSSAQLKSNWSTFENALAGCHHQICYAVKANSNVAILQLLARLNAGFDIVSIGELKRVLKAGGHPNKIIYSGVGKQTHEIEYAIHTGIYCFNVESEAELERLQHIASRLKKHVNIALRVNPHVDPATHAYISTGMRDNKFGICIEDVFSLCTRLAQFNHLHLIGIAAHIGSQITDLEPFMLAIDRLLNLYEQLRAQGIALKTINVGGGLGIPYHHETPPSIDRYVQAIKNKFTDYPLEIILEPGRAIVGNAGLLLTKIEYLKITASKNFAIVDAGMNDLLRPALYDAWQPILPVQLDPKREKRIVDVVGPICESADFLGKERELAVAPQDLLAIDCVGAYGSSMASNYNSRPRAAEVLVDNQQCHLIRSRETPDELFTAEHLLPS